MFQKITRKHLDAFLKKHATEEEVLDIGAGGSGYGKYFPNRVTVDIDPNRSPDIVADAHELPFQNNAFSHVLCTEVLEHVKEPKKVISELRRVLKPGGTLILTTRFVYPIHDSPHDYWRFTRYGMELLFQDWKIIELQSEVSTMKTIAVLLQRIAYQSDLRANKVSKLFFFVLASLFSSMAWLIKDEYGDITRNSKEADILSSGYYVVCQKI